MNFRYRIEIDYESPTEWSIGPVFSIPSGDEASPEEIATVLEATAALLRQSFGDEPEMGPCVRYPARSQDPEETR